ncbi:unnamed protein product, partial [marine sediment metagenome]
DCLGQYWYHLLSHFSLPFSAFHDGISLDQTGTAMGAVAVDIQLH